MNIKDKHCLVTGAGRGLGREIAIELSRCGGIVNVCDINSEALKGLDDTAEAQEIKQYICDVSNEESVKDMFSDIPQLDILINNAGITRDGLLIKKKNNITKVMSLTDFQNVINVNLTGVFLCGREAAIKMAEGTGGVIINISSVSRAGNFGQTNYSAAKAGVDAMTITWSKELARYNIRCAAIAPGYIETEMVSKINPDMLDKITSQIPIKRLGKMNEIAETARFIIENDFINGKVMEVDGGLRI